MKVSEMPYEHINFEEFEKNALEIINGVRNAKSADEVLEWRKKYLGLVIEYSTAMNISYIRYSCNTADEFYVKENDYFDEIGPQVGNLMNNYNDALLNSPFRAELEEKLKSNRFDFNDLLDQFEQMKKMGPLKQLLGMIPGVNANALKNVNIDDKIMLRTEAIIKSMTVFERENPGAINSSRKRMRLIVRLA